jgi:hypothetical protein
VETIKTTPIKHGPLPVKSIYTWDGHSAFTGLPIEEGRAASGKSFPFPVHFEFFAGFTFCQVRLYVYKYKYIS